MNRPLLRSFSQAIFFLGVILGFALAVILLWSRMEATHYFFSGAQYDAFDGLHCPLIIAPAEKGVVTATFDNPSDREVNFLYRAEISGAVSTRPLEGQVAVPPHQKKRVELIVDANDRVLQYFVFVKLNALPNALHPSREAVCGTLITGSLGLSGSQVPVVALFLSVLGIAAGLGIWSRNRSRKEQTLLRVMQILGGIVLLTILAGLMGWWLIGMVLCAITLLLVLISFRLAAI